jgi:hypothetical protein
MLEKGGSSPCGSDPNDPERIELDAAVMGEEANRTSTKLGARIRHHDLRPRTPFASGPDRELVAAMADDNAY